MKTIATKTINTNVDTAIYEIRQYEKGFVLDSISLYEGTRAPRTTREVGRFDSEEEAVICAIKNIYRRGLAIA